MGVPPEKWGPYFWGVIHLGCLTGSITPEFIAMYPSVIPCGMCGQHFAELLKEMPFPDSRDPLVLFKWSVDAHNLVNERTGKPILSVEEALKIWTTEPAPPEPSKQFDLSIGILLAILFLILILIFMYNRK